MRCWRFWIAERETRVSKVDTSRLEPITLQGAKGHRLAGSVYAPQGETLRGVVLLLHGGGQTRHAWDRSARDIARAGFTAVSMDQRGHGGSEWPQDGAYAFRDYGDDAVAMARQLAGRFGVRPVIVGASLGGIAAMLAEGQAGPDIWQAMVLVDITPQMDPVGVDRIQAFMGADMADGFASIEDAAYAVAAYLPNRPRPRSLDGLRKNLRRDEDGRYRWHWDPRFLDGPRSINTDRDQAESAMSQGVRNTRIPVLLVRGASSELISTDHAQAFQALVPHAQIVDVSGAGHMVAGDRNDVFSAAIVDFLVNSCETD